MDEGDLFCRDAHGDQLRSQVIVDIELAIVMRCREVTKNHLGGFSLHCALPNLIDIGSAGGNLACFAVREHITHKALIQSQLSAVIGDEQHIIGAGVHHLIANTLGSFGEGRDHLLLMLRRFQHHMVVMGFGNRKL